MADGSEFEGLEWLSDYVLHFLKAPTWITPIAQFVDEHCIIFDAPDEENKLEYTTCHNSFKGLIDDLFVAHLLEVCVTYEQFEHFCQNGLERNPRLHHVLVEQMLSVDDFLTFKAMMTKRNTDLYSEAMQRIQQVEATGAAPAGEQLAEAAAALPSCQYSGDAYDSMVQELDEEDPDEKAGESLAQEWRMYEDQLFQVEEQRDQDAKVREEAELEQAIALSLQAEEERIRLIAVAEQEQAAAAAAAAAAEAAALVAESPPAPDVPPVEVQAPGPPGRTAPREAVLPKVMKVKPLRATAQLPPLAPPPGSGAAAELERRQCMAILQRERAERVIATPAPSASEEVLAAASAQPAAPPQPTEEERRQRAEHLRRTRELLVAKRNQERQRAVGEYRASGGAGRAAADRFGPGVQPQASTDGKNMVELLAPASGGPAVPVQDAAAQMRQALAAQLRQTLTTTVPSGTADNRLGRLEQMKQQ